MFKSSIRGFENTNVVGSGSTIGKLGRMCNSKNAGRIALGLTVFVGTVKTVKAIKRGDN